MLPRTFGADFRTWLYDMRLKEGSTLGEGHPALGFGTAREDESQLYD